MTEMKITISSANRFVKVDLGSFIKSEQSKSTTCKTASHSAIFKQYLALERDTDFENYSSTELDNHLANLVIKRCKVGLVKKKKRLTRRERKAADLKKSDSRGAKPGGTDA